MKTECTSGLYWHNCYSGTYDLIAPDSYAHPAKMSVALCFRILEHLADLGLLNKGDTVLDCMAGTGITNICAGAKDYKSISVELEEKFIGFQKQNLEYAERKLYKKLDWQIIQGDSRNLSNLLAERGVVSVVSPPYAESITSDHNNGRIERVRKAMAKGQRFSHETERLANGAVCHSQVLMDNEYSSNPANIGNLKDVPLVTVVSPPYGDAVNTEKCGIDFSKTKLDYPGRVWHEGRIKQHKERSDNMIYGSASGQIGSLPDKPLVSVMSPPYATRMDGGSTREGYVHIKPYDSDGKGDDYRKRWPTERSAENIGNLMDDVQHRDERESYLSAMSKVYSEIAKVSNVLAVVIKNPTRNGKLRRLDLDTVKILEDTSWTIHCQHRALLFEELEQGDMFAGSKKRVKVRLSFFKRLSWQNGQPVASWEDIIFAVKK